MCTRSSISVFEAVYEQKASPDDNKIDVQLYDKHKLIKNNKIKKALLFDKREGL